MENNLCLHINNYLSIPELLLSHLFQQSIQTTFFFNQPTGNETYSLGKKKFKIVSAQ